MRRFLALLVLSACTMTAPVDNTGPGVTGLDNSAIEVTALAPASAAPVATAAPLAQTAQAAGNEGPVTAQAARPGTPHPKPRPAAPAGGTATDAAAAAEPVQTPALDAAPPVPVSPQQALCEKSGGQWSTVPDSGASLCVKRTRDGGKRCAAEKDCQGRCLARSNTCSPIDPMIGCNDILDNQGRMVTLCLN